LGLLCLSHPASASTFYLNQSNTLPDGVNYAQVDVLANGSNLDFTVKALDPTGWKFSNFYFNLAGDPGTVLITGGPAWTVDTNQYISVFGLFSDGDKGNGNTLQSQFSFTVDAVASLTLASLVPNSSGWIFAAHMQCQNNPVGTCVSDSATGESSHFVAGPSVVPLPAAAWLFGSALFGFMMVSNRRKV
jgi:hypothetical protein